MMGIAIIRGIRLFSSKNPRMIGYQTCLRFDAAAAVRAFDENTITTIT